MKLGVCIFFTEYSIRPDALGVALEERDIESLWVPEHTHIPLDTGARELGSNQLPKEYWHAYDPFVALATAAASTRRLKLGTGVALVPERDPLGTAKQVATLDHLSGGRLLFGIGAGWNAEETANHGVDFRQRWDIQRDRIRAMQAVWSGHEASYEGPHVRFGPMLAYPKPVQKPWPPIYLGGHGPRALRHALEYCDGWLPIQDRGRPISAALDQMRQMAEQAGRAPLPVSVYKARPELENLQHLQQLGVERALLLLPSAPGEELFPLLDRYAGWIGCLSP